MSFSQRIQRGQPEYRVANFKNGEASTAITLGQPVCYDYTTAADGFTVKLPVTANLQFPAGLVAQASIAGGDYGQVCTGGHFASAAVLGTTAVAVNDPLVISNGLTTLSKATLVTNAVGQFKPCFVAGAAQAVTGPVATKVQVNC